MFTLLSLINRVSQLDSFPIEEARGTETDWYRRGGSVACSALDAWGPKLCKRQLRRYSTKSFWFLCPLRLTSPAQPCSLISPAAAQTAPQSINTWLASCAAHHEFDHNKSKTMHLYTQQLIGLIVSIWHIDAIRHALQQAEGSALLLLPSQHRLCYDQA